MPDHEPILTALRRVMDPCSIATGVPINLVDMGLVKAVANDAGDIRIELRLTSPICWQAANIIAKVEEVVAPLPGVHSVVCSLEASSDWMPDMIAPHARERLRHVRPLAEAANR